MKKKVLLVFGLSFALLLGSFGSAFAAFQVAPLKQAQNNYKDKYQTDLFTGSANYSYEINVPKGTNDLTPNVSISYSSAGVRDAFTTVGMGWQLSRDYVERDSNYTPNNTSDDKFKLHFQGMTYDLVYVSSENRWHTKLESFLHITKQSGGSNDKGEYWQVITQDGTKYRFGYLSNSELLCEGKNFNTNQDRNYILRWNLDEVTDTHDNHMYYTYIETNGTSYLSKIEYNTDKQRSVNFAYHGNPYLHPVYFQSCKMHDVNQLENIQVKIGTTPVRQYDFSYTTLPFGQSYLQTITEKGSDGSALPATSFEYKPWVKNWQTPPGAPWINGASIDSHIGKIDVAMADVNGDGFTDIVRSWDTPEGVAYATLINNQNSWSTQFQPWLTNPNMDDSHLNRDDTRIMDVTGDGLPDIVRTNATQWWVYRNDGTHFNNNKEIWTDLGTIHSSVNLPNPNVTLADVTGDGLPDIIRSWWNGKRQWEVVKNLGDHWHTGSDVWSYDGIPMELSDSNVRIIDVNGDSLADLVWSTHNGTVATWNVYKNSGDSWNTVPEPWLSNANVDAYLGHADVTLADANGDGLPDIIRSTDNGVNDKWEVLINKGDSWTTSWEPWIEPSAHQDLDIHSDKLRLVDVTGDGLADIVTGVPSGANATWTVWKNNGNAPDLLSRITTSQGGTISFDYKPSSIYDNTGENSLSDLPFPVWVVEKMTVNNGLAAPQGTNSVTTYTYKDGFYKWQDKEFRGFREVNTTEPNGSKKIYVFNQADGLSGKMNSYQVFDSSNNIYSKDDYYWSTTQANGVYTSKLDTEKHYTYDGSAANDKIVQIDFLYDTYGNVTKKSELGDTSVTGDERFTYNQYVYNTSAWIVSTVKRTYRNAANDTTKVSESMFYYDGHTGLDDAPTKGDVTKEVKWLEGLLAHSPETLYAYDTYGNQTSVTDDNNHVTTTAYDTTGTYPTSTTNAKNQTTTTSYDLGTGNLLSKTDPNGFVTTYVYDVFWRLTKEIKPYDSSGYPSISYQYLFDGIAPEGTRVSKLEVSSQSGTIDVYTFVDGLGRKVQTRSDAEDTSKQIVVDNYYDETGQLWKETVPYLSESSAIETQPTPAPPTATKFGDGNAGDIAITTNTTEAPNDSSVSGNAGSTNATVAQGVAFAPNQIVLFHQTQGTNAGTWELARIEAYSGTTLTITTPLANTYSSSGNNHAQVRVVPQYYNVIVHSGVTWSAKAWNGTTGGILAFLAKGTVTVNGTISATGKGFRGGGEGQDDYGWTGEGSGVPSVLGNTPDPAGNGGGFSHVSSAGGGNAETINGSESSVGSAAGTNDLTTMVLGGGGAGGASYNTDGLGGNGGGVIFVRGATIDVNGAMTSAGMTGGNTSNGRPGAGGAGGSILLKGQTISLGTNIVTAAYGNPGTGGNDPRSVRGSYGRIRVQYENSATGSTSPSASSAQSTVPLIPAGVVPVDPPAGAYGVYVTPDLNAKFTEFTYDPLNRITITKNPKGDSKTTAYDHWKETTVDEKGHIKRNFKNAYGKIAKVEEVNGVNTYTTNYTYNARDELTRITDNASNNFDFEYDTLGRKTKQIDPDMGIWEYTYDGVGNQLTEKDNKNVTVTKTYDELNRVTRADYPNDTDIVYTYDGNNKKGTLTSVVDVAGTVTYGYDERLRKIQETRVIDGTTMATGFTYDAADRVLTRTNPDNTTITYTYNAQGEVDTVNGVVSDIDYNAQNKITTKDFANGVSTDYTYNSNDFRLSRIQTGTLFDNNYTYDDVGNVETITDNLLSKTQTYGYDDLDRLINASESAGFTYAYEYNPIGNLTKFIDGSTEIDYTYGQNAGVHALTSSTEEAPVPGTELLSSPWQLTGNNGSDEESMGIPANSLVGSESVQVTFNLNGANFGGGDDEASVYFVQNGDWRAANVVVNGAQNGQNGSQTVTIPISDFHKVGDSNVVLDPNQAVSDVGARFWNSGSFTVNITSIKLLGSGGGSTPTPTPTTVAPTATPTPTPSGNNGTPYGGTARTVPGTIQVEDFNVGGESIAYHDIDSSNNGGEYRVNEGVDIGSDNGVYGIGWTQEGEWLKYTINVTTTGTYTFQVRVASPNDNAKIHAEIDGVDVTGPITINSTGGWSSWTTLSKSGINLTSGQHILKLVLDQRSTQEQWIGNIDWLSFTSESSSTPTPTPTPGAWTELLGTTWTLAGSNGSDEESKGIASNSLNGKSTVQVTFNLHGTSFGGGDDEASVYFVQNNDWRAANLIVNGAQNGLNGSQTVTIPISNFHKVGDSNVVLNANQAVSDLGTRFWNSGAFSVDVTSIKVQ